ncbi:uncharacterized protein Fot_14623 [Forsythia ovata]|uniref:DUF1985 domain-containing protein n=1 Tax=Forsythia ovata TaxID=205694 RepID=A0ABD1WAE0_9LAMI
MNGDVYEAFKRCKRNKTDKYKLGLIIILAYVLLATEEKILIDLWWFKLVDDLDRFDKYPWEKMSFEYTIRILKRDTGDKLRNSLKGGESRCRYSLHGFLLAIMIWAFEAIPSLGKKFAKKYANGIPRILAWEMPKRLTLSAVDNVLESKEYKIDSLIELAVVDRFHSTTSAYESPICNTTNVPEAQLEMEIKKEAGLDDAMDEIEKRKNIRR